MSTAAPPSAVTKCPHCGAKFRVRQEHVRLHSGLVRCGACRGIFDALENLIEGYLPPTRRPEPGSDVVPESPRTIIQDGPAVQQQVEAAAAEHNAARGAVTPVAEPSVPTPAPESPLVPESVMAAPVMSAPSKGVAEPAGGDDEFQVRNPDAGEDEAVEAFAPAVASPSDDADNADSAEAAAMQARAAETAPEQSRDYRWKAPARPLSAGAKWFYGALCLIALLALAGQGAYLYRDELASRYPQSLPALQAACGLLRCEVGPPKRADELGFVYSSLEADPAHRGLLIFVATMRNNAGRAVAYPHLILTLDGIDGRIASRRVFAPNDYLPASANLANGLEGRSEVEIKIYLDASQTNIVGFKVDHAYL